MQPAAARVGPSNEPSVRRIAVRFSSGATICIENTIKVWFLSVASKTDKTSSAHLHRKKRANPRSKRHQRGKTHQNSEIRNQAGGPLRASNPGVLRNFGGDSEISEETPKSRRRFNSRKHGLAAYKIS